MLLHPYNTIEVNRVNKEITVQQALLSQFNAHQELTTKILLWVIPHNVLFVRLVLQIQSMEHKVVKLVVSLPIVMKAPQSVNAMVKTEFTHQLIIHADV